MKNIFSLETSSTKNYFRWKPLTWKPWYNTRFFLILFSLLPFFLFFLFEFTCLFASFFFSLLDLEKGRVKLKKRT